MIFSLLLVPLGVGGAAQSTAELAQRTGLDQDLVGVMEVRVGGTDLAIVFVFINERTFDSSVSPALRAQLLPYVGQNAVYVNPSIESVATQFPFDPLGISIQQVGGEAAATTLEMWREITPGFLDGRFTVNPSGASQGSGSEGILLLGAAIDSSGPFVITYGEQTVRFDIGAAQGPTSAGTAVGGTSGVTAYEPVDVDPLATVATLADLLALDGLTAEDLADLLGLTQERVGMIEYVAGTETLRIVLVQLEEDVRESALGEELLASVDPLIGSGAIMIWAYSPTAAPFKPWDFVVKQSGSHYWYTADDSFVELTDGFRRVVRLAAGELAAGVMRLHSRMNADEPFSVFYKSPTIGEVAFP